MLDLIFLLIKTRLENKVPELEEVDWYLRQYEQNGDNEFCVSTGAYIEFNSMPTEEMGYGVQSIDATFTIHLAQQNLYDTGKRITDSALDHTGLVSKIYTALSGYEGFLSHLEGFEALAGTEQDVLIVNRIARTNIDPDHTLEGIMATLQQFSTIAIDYSALPQMQKILAELKMNK